MRPLDFCPPQVYASSTYVSLIVLPTAGVREQRLSASLGLFSPQVYYAINTWGFCVCPRYLPKAGVRDLVHATFSHHRYMQGHLVTADLLGWKGGR